MNDERALSDLKEITQAQYAKAQQSFAKLVAEENMLRSELSRLDAMRLQASTADPNAIQMQSIGADIIWQGWIGRAKAALNMRLAQVLALKEHHLAAVRRAYGKVLVGEELYDTQKTSARQARADAVLAQAIESSLY